MPVEASPKKCARSFASMSEDDFLDDRDRVTAFDADAAVLRELVGKRLFFSSSFSSSSSSSSNWTSDDV
tara:strand:+ start:218 stop:424 length:207 start_codon:yes stop_codon:yes gene_type:complete